MSAQYTGRRYACIHTFLDTFLDMVLRTCTHICTHYVRTHVSTHSQSLVLRVASRVVALPCHWPDQACATASVTKHMATFVARRDSQRRSAAGSWSFLITPIGMETARTHARTHARARTHACARAHTRTHACTWVSPSNVTNTFSYKCLYARRYRFVYSCLLHISIPMRKLMSSGMSIHAHMHVHTHPHTLSRTDIYLHTCLCTCHTHINTHVCKQVS